MQDEITSCVRAMAQGGAIRQQGIARLATLAAEGGEDTRLAKGVLLDAFAVESEALGDAALGQALISLDLIDVARALRDMASGDVDRRWRALSHIDGSRHPKALEALIEAAKDPVARIRREAIRALGTSIDASPRLLEFLASRDYLERQHAVAALRGLLVDDDDHRWHRGRRTCAAAVETRRVLIERGRAVDLAGDGTLREISPLIGLWDDAETREVARIGCRLRIVAPAALALLLSSDDAQDHLALFDLLSSAPVAARWEVLAAFQNHVTGVDAHSEEVLSRVAELCLPEHAEHFAYLLWIAARAGLSNTIQILEHAVADGLAPLSASALLRILEALAWLGPEAAALLPQIREIAAAADDPHTHGALAVATFAVTGDDAQRASVEAWACGDGELTDHVPLPADELGLDAAQRLQGFALYALAHHQGKPDDDTLLGLLELRGRDHLQWSPAFAACHAVVADLALLRCALAKDFDAVRSDVRAYLYVLRGEAHETGALETLSTVFSSSSTALRKRAVRVLGTLDATVEPMIDLVLEGRLEDVDHSVQHLAAETLQGRTYR